jgi:eukaryotic-like serine/threonine-protein kinase
MPMDAARWERIQSLFHQALELPEAERLALLVARCGGDAELLAEVLALLEEDARGGSVLERDLASVAHEVLDGSVPLLRRVGSYRVLRVLGQGGMGVVYLGEREDPHSLVAIKVLRDASLSPARRERFRREEQTLAQLNHPSIARLYDADVLADGTPYFVMEYVEGVPLTEYCRTHRCSVTERLRLFRAVCEAVQHAHSRAVIHRDLKPSNILVSDGGTGGRVTVKLLDFGIAKQLESLDAPADPTQTGLRLMTPAYAAPEQLQGEPAGVYTDVYALGVLLYELLTEQHPFELAGLTPGQVENLILESGPARPSASARQAAGAAAAAVQASSLSRGEWEDLDVLCLTAMHQDPQRRYATVEALVRDLEHFGKGEPLEARPDTLRYRTGKFLRRNRQPVTAGALVTAAVIALVSFYTVQLAEQRDRAQTEAAKAERISEYLIGLFEAGDPYAAEAENLDVRTLLERGERRAEELAGQPAVKAQLLNVLGRVYTQLSDFDRAEPLLQRALEQRRELGTPLDLAESLSSLANLYVDTGNYDGADAALREALSLRERHLPPNHPDLADNLRELGTVLSYHGRYPEAETLHRLALRMRRVIHDRPHEELGAALNALAVAVYNQGNYAAAERYYRESLAVNRAVFGREHASVTRVLANLGKLYEELGNYTAADSLLSEALRIRRATLGNDHFETAVGLGQLGSLLLNAGEHERAEDALRESLAIRERILAPNHPSIGTTMNGLALTYQHRGRYDEADSLFRRVVEIYRESLGERHRFTGVALSNLAHLLQLKSELNEAYAHLREGVSILEEVHPENHQELAHNRGRLGGVLTALGRYTEAEPLLRQSHRTLQEQLGTEHARTRQAAQRLVELYEAWGRPAEAESYRLVLANAATGSPWTALSRQQATGPSGWSRCAARSRR